jgi:hypothetical protein
MEAVRRPLGLLFIIASVMVAACVSACSSAGPATPTPNGSMIGAAAQLKLNGVPPTGSIPVVTGQVSTQLPLDLYMLSPTQVATIDIAERKAEQNCIIRYFPGISLGSYGRTVLESLSNEPLVYVAPAQAARYGYHDPAIQRELTEIAPPGSAQVTAVAQGTVKTMNNMTVPAKGCQAVGVQAVIHGISTSLLPLGNANLATVAGVANAIDRDVVQNDPRVTSVNAKWASCMAQSGYSYSSPLAAVNNQQWSLANIPTAKIKHPPITAAEIKTAVADVACRSKVNVYGVYWTVAAAYQNEWLADNQDRSLAQAQEQADQLMLTRAQTIIG